MTKKKAITINDKKKVLKYRKFACSQLVNSVFTNYSIVQLFDCSTIRFFIYSISTIRTLNYLIFQFFAIFNYSINSTIRLIQLFDFFNYSIFFNFFK